MPSRNSLKTKETKERKIFSTHASSRLRMLKRPRFSVTRSRESSILQDKDRQISINHLKSTRMIRLELAQISKPLIRRSMN